MLLLLNGPPGVGKTAVSRRLLLRLGDAVLLDGDALAAFPPLDLADADYRRRGRTALLALLAHHRQAGCEHFVVNWVFPVPSEFERFLDALAEQVAPVQAFRLTCPFDVLKSRVLAGLDPGDDPAPLLRAARAWQERLNDAGGEATLGRVVQTGGLDPEAIADRLWAISRVEGGVDARSGHGH